MPLKIKQLDGEVKSPAKNLPGGGKEKFNALADKPCRFFLSDQGCKAGKSCKWQHSWEGVSDKTSRCWKCGSKEHRKNECPVKGGKKPGEPNVGPGGGRGATSASAPSSSSTSTGGKAGAAAAVKVAKNAEDATSTTIVEEDVKSPEKTSSTTSGVKDGNGGGVMVDQKVTAKWLNFCMKPHNC